MTRYTKSFTVRWADMDANVHMRHSAYNDYAAHTRLMFLSENGYGMEWFKVHNVYPVLLREETVFLREIKGNEVISVDVMVQRMTEDGSRWSIVNRFFKQDGTLAARITVDGAWMDLVTRKLKAPPAEVLQFFVNVERTDDFEWIVREKK